MAPQDNTKQHIIDIATTLFNQQNYDAVSMSTIAQHVGITKAALYYHFQSKHDLFYHCIHTTTDSFIEKIKEILAQETDTIETQLTAINTIHIEFILENHGFMNYLHHKSESGQDNIMELVYTKRETVATLMEPLLKKIIEKRNFKEPITPKDISAALLGLTQSLLCESHMTHTTCNKDILAKKITALILA